MALKLNATREAYKEFPGSNIEQMPKLRADDRVPISVAGLMQRRLDVRNSDAELNASYLDNYFDTGDGVVYHPNGRVKIVLDSQHLRDMTPESTRTRNGGALVLTEDAYKVLEGEEFKEGKLGKVNTWLSKKEVKAHPVWGALARDQALLDDYTDYIFAEGKERFDYDTAMGIFPGSANGDLPEMWAWCVPRLGGRPYAGAWRDLASVDGRLLGIAPEALSVVGVGE